MICKFTFCLLLRVHSTLIRGAAGGRFLVVFTHRSRSHVMSELNHRTVQSYLFPRLLDELSMVVLCSIAGDTKVDLMDGGSCSMFMVCYLVYLVLISKVIYSLQMSLGITLTIGIRNWLYMTHMNMMNSNK